jgi:sec-independent protein translocase protein TatC
MMGIIFQLPIAAVVLGKAGLINQEMMRKYRSYFIIAILIFSALATPPDMISQALVTLPVIGLYQLSIYLVGKVK